MAVTRVITSSSGISAAELKVLFYFPNPVEFFKFQEGIKLCIRFVYPLQQEQETDESNGSLQLYERLSFSYPSLLLPLIHERDTVSIKTETEPNCVDTFCR